jgi:hypothetical protein
MNTKWKIVDRFGVGIGARSFDLYIGEQDRANMYKNSAVIYANKATVMVEPARVSKPIRKPAPASTTTTKALIP